MKILLFVFTLFSITTFGQIPEGYYNSAEGLSGQALREELKDIIDDHQEQSYASIWTHFQTTDENINGKVWDMYSDIPGGNPAYVYSFVIDQCGNYSAEGDCYNREHSFPKSWFNDAAPMVTDLFHIFPTDGYVNGKRSNYPFGEVSNASWTSTNGSNLGNSAITGYYGVVFEPINEYKGDFARTYFYMLTRYMDEVSNWSSDMLSGNDFATWAKEMLLEWNEEDPVSLKETDRNNAVYEIQNNRNPFIDHPEYVALIWDSPADLTEKDIRNKDIRIWYSGGSVHIESQTEIAGQLKIIGLQGCHLEIFNIKGSEIILPIDKKDGIFIAVIETSKLFKAYKLVIID
jgi:endonuclease I